MSASEYSHKICVPSLDIESHQIHKDQQNRDLHNYKETFTQSSQTLIQNLRQDLRRKQAEVNSKNQIIKNLQEKSILVVAYEKKIQTLQLRLSKLQAFLNKIQGEGFSYQNQNEICKPVNKTTKHGQCVLEKRQQNKSKLQHQQYIVQDHKDYFVNSNDFYQPNEKENKRSSIKLKNKQYESIKNEKLASSKLLRFQKASQEKQQQIDQKFNRLKSNLNSIDRPKSTKNMEEIYTMLKSKRQEIYLHDINKKLQSILDESNRLNSNSEYSKQRPSSKYSQGALFLNSFELYEQNIRNRKTENGLTFNINNSVSLRKSGQGYPKSQQSMTDRILGLHHRQMGKQKLARILNSTTVDDILKARKHQIYNGGIHATLSKAQYCRPERLERTKTSWN